MMNLNDLRRELETSEPVRLKFAKQSEFTITAGQFAATVAQAFGVEKEAKLLSDGMGAETPLFRVRPRRGDENLPSVVTSSAWAGDDAVEVLAADLSVVPATITKSRIGPGGYVIVSIGKATVQVPLMMSDELRGDLIALRNDGQEGPEFAEVEGHPVLELESPFSGDTISTVAFAPQRDIPPHSDDIPKNVDLEVLEVLKPSRQYKSPRLKVATPDGNIIVGLIATQPIARALTGQYEGAVELTDAVVGQKVEILGVEDRVRRDGEKVVNEDGTVQKSVIARNSTKKLEFEL